MKERRKDHALILDLNAHVSGDWNRTSYGSTTLSSKEFEGTNWVWSTLNNFGGNSSMHGNLQKMADDIWNARQNSSFMKGVGCISEGAYDNPVVYALLFDCIWSDEKVDVKTWIEDYITARYGAVSESASAAWDKMLDTIYKQWIGYGWHFEAMTGDSSSYATYSYKLEDVQEILRLLMEDFDTLKTSDAYLYDLMDVMKTAVNMHSISKKEELEEDFAYGDLKAFDKSSSEMLALFDLADAICGTQKDYMVGEWIGRAEDWAEGMDDWSKDMMPIDAKLLLTEWNSNALTDYVHRTYSGLLKDVYKPQKQAAYDLMHRKLTGEADMDEELPNIKDPLYWNWIYSKTEYSRTPDRSDENFRSLADQVLALKNKAADASNLCLNKPVEVSAEYFGDNGTKAVDGDANSWWDAGAYSKKPWIIVDLEKPMEVDRAFVSNVWSWGSRYYQYNVYGSLDKENWTLLSEKTSTNDATKTGDQFRFNDGINIRYLKIEGLYNSANASFHVTEIRAFGQDRITALNELIARASEIDLSNAPEDKVQALQDAMNAAAALTGSLQTTNTDFDQAEAALEAAIAALTTPAESGNTILLEMAVNKALELQSANALEGVNALVVRAFEESLAKAQGILAAEQAGQAEINEAWNDLCRAIQMLGFKTDFSVLDLLLERAMDIDPDSISDEALRAELLDAIAYGEQVRESETSLTDISIAQAVSRLQDILDAIAGEQSLDVSLLELLVSAVADTDLSLYLESGKDAFAAALEQAQAVLAAPESQPQIDQAVETLHNAWLNLRLKADEELLGKLQDLLGKLRSAADTYTLSASEQQAITRMADHIEAMLAAPETDALEAQAAVDEAQTLLSSLTRKTGDSSSRADSLQNAGSSDVKAASVKTSASFAGQAAGFGAAFAAAAALILSFGKKKRSGK